MRSKRTRRDPRMNILVTIDAGYIGPFKVMAKSLVLNNPDSKVRFLLVHSDVDMEELSALHAYCDVIGADFAAFRVDRDDFADLPTSKRYPVEVYYRLLAPFILPSSIERVIYLDCDMLVVNSLRPLWDMDLEGRAYAAASHSGEASAVDALNQIRLDTDHAYFNTGLLVMDLARARRVLTLEKFASCVAELGRLVVLPDQDVFNAACGQITLSLDDQLWNYDVRKFSQYKAASLGKHGMDWVMQNTAVLHFCGPIKPWRKSYSGRFSSLYKHYANLAARDDAYGRQAGVLPRLEGRVLSVSD